MDSTHVSVWFVDSTHVSKDFERNQASRRNKGRLDEGRLDESRFDGQRQRSVLTVVALISGGDQISPSP